MVIGTRDEPMETNLLNYSWAQMPFEVQRPLISDKYKKGARRNLYTRTEKTIILPQ